MSTVLGRTFRIDCPICGTNVRAVVDNIGGCVGCGANWIASTEAHDCKDGFLLYTWHYEKEEGDPDPTHEDWKLLMMLNDVFSVKNS